MPDKKVALYCRVAHEDQVAMNLQLSHLRRFAETRGLGPCVEYLDNGCSGLSDNRPAFQRMNADIENREIGMVLMTYISRLGRQYENVHLAQENQPPPSACHLY